MAATRLAIVAAAALAAAAQPSRVNSTCSPSTASLYDMNVTLQGGAHLALSAWRGNVTMLMNEPGNDGEILPTLKYVRPGGGYVPAFPLTLITNVNGGTGVHPAISLIKAACPLGPTDTVASGGSPLWDPISVGDLQWNFEKILFDKQGRPYRRYSTALQPSDLRADINALLAAA